MTSPSSSSDDRVFPSTHVHSPQKQLRVVEWEHLNLWKFYPLSMATSWSVRCMMYPMTVVRARLQLQRKTSVYSGMMDAFSRIVAQEGFTALYRGFWITLPQLSTAIIYSSVYERVRDLIQVHAGISHAPLISALSGAAASVCNQTIFVPTDIVAQYLMIHKNPIAFMGSSKNTAVIDLLRDTQFEKRRTLGVRVVKAVYRVDGFRGFYRGFLSSLMLYIPSNMVFWSSYFILLDWLRIARRRIERVYGRVSEREPRGLFIDQAVAGGASGAISAICTNPLEMLRIRIQMHRTSYRETVSELVRVERLRVFTKGLAPRVLSNSAYSCLIMLSYETVKKACVLPEFRDAVVW